ncbi:polymorphic outer membrane protein repeat-containing protein [Spirosomataceae bacterium TFI 002]|nr:polymorphic outer membrane protein repeat-containing protein [Spirosomataceae bacterium TFI 002]
MKKLLFVALLFAPISANATIRYVVSGNSNSNFGTSWASAKGNLQTVINASTSGDTILVAAGTYYPDSYPAGCTNCNSNRDFTFDMKNGVRIFGGFNQYDTWAQRDPRTKKTILDGNIGQLLSNTDNVHHVVTAIAAGIFVLDGFIIRNGNANQNSTISVPRNSQSHSISRNEGAGVYQNNCDFGKIANCEIYNNNSYNGAGMYLLNCFDVPIDLQSMVFRNNTATNYGGAIALENSKITVKSSLFYTNAASTGGKAIDVYDNSDLGLMMCTVYQNTPANSGSVINVESDSDLEFNMSILWENYSSSSTPSVSISSNSSSFFGQSIVEGGISSCINCPNTNGNINPEFRNANDVNGLDNYYGTSDDGLILKTCSPGIDYPLTNYGISIPNMDVALRNRENDYNLDNPETYDIGAYERYNDQPKEKIYVNTNMVTGLDNGTSPTNAFRGAASLHNALLAAGSSCDEVEILIAGGAYRPRAYPTSCTGCTTVSDYTFLLPSNASLVGGYDPSFTYRNLNFYPVYLDGNVGSLSDSLDNAHHILLTMETIGQPNKIEGVTFRNGGNIDVVSGTSSSTSIQVGSINIYRSNGGAIYNMGGGTDLQDCTFENNHASRGVLYVSMNAANYGGFFDDIAFRNNVSIPIPVSGGFTISSLIYGNESQFTLNNSILNENWSNNPEAFVNVYLNNSEVNIIRSKFIENEGDFLNSVNSGLTMTNSLIYDQKGASLDIRGLVAGASNTAISHCNFVYSNSSYYPIRLNSGTLSVDNSVLWSANSSGSNIYISPSFSGPTPTVSNSIIKNGWTGCVNCPGGNGNVDPQFKNINSLYGEYDETDGFDDGLYPQVSSPMVDGGTFGGLTYTDINGNLAQGWSSDIGAFEGIPADLCRLSRYYTDKTLPSGTYRATSKIISESHINSASNVIMGGHSVILMPGFEAKTGAVFLADPDENCGSL